jgi:hypothetical protein
MRDDDACHGASVPVQEYPIAPPKHVIAVFGPQVDETVALAVQQ